MALSLPRFALPAWLPRRRAKTPGAEEKSHSRHVRKLTPRQPLPKRKGDLLILLSQKARHFPLVLACAAGFAFVVFTFHKYLMNSGYFSVAAIDISGTERLSESQVLRVLHSRTGVQVGESIFNASEATMRQALESIPEVEIASVRKEWPATISVMIEEKKAFGIFATETASYVYDGRGTVFARANAGDFRGVAKPLITATPKADVQPGYKLPIVDLARAEQYLEVFQKAAPALAGRISEFHFQPETGMTVVLAGGERFECGSRPPHETGPAIESLLIPSLEAPVLAANLISPTYAIIRRADPLTTITDKQIAKNE